LSLLREVVIVMNIVMPTSIHLPAPLLEAVDARARHLGISRNRLIVRALEREVTEGSDWSPEFFERLGTTDAETRQAVDELVAAVRAGRTSKKPRQL
jgi:hypothetical protein